MVAGSVVFPPSAAEQSLLSFSHGAVSGGSNLSQADKTPITQIQDLNNNRTCILICQAKFVTSEAKNIFTDSNTDP
jgi:hypothetical protein